MKKFYLLFFAISILFLAGCQTKSTIEYVTKYETVTTVLEPPRELYSKQKRIKPPPVDKYEQASFEDKESMLFSHIAELNKQITSLIVDRSSMEKWVDKNKKMINEKKEQK